MKLIDLKGRVFGRLIVIERSDRNDVGGKPRWVCLCVCKNVHVTSGCSLKSGDVRSCGCLKKDMDPFINRKHGMSNTWQIQLLKRIKDKCRNPKNQDYKYYGGRGISYDERWNDSSVFIKDINSLGERPTGYTLDRRDNEGGYFLHNLRWASRKEQSHNRRDNVIR